jgi:hypothetical protein
MFRHHLKNQPYHKMKIATIKIPNKLKMNKPKKIMKILIFPLLRQFYFKNLNKMRVTKNKAKILEIFLNFKIMRLKI